MTEFELIARFFDRPGAGRSSTVRLGIGDDCALLVPKAGHELAISTDMLVAGRHFFDDADPASLGWKALAVNLSDLAAMGAQPLAFTLAVALPSIDEAWVAAFARGLFECSDAFGCPLVGGDTTRGPLTLSVTVIGEVPQGVASRRSAARSGDDVWVSGLIGSAALALQRVMSGGDIDRPRIDALDRPVPRIALGVALRGIAHAAIDVSDGLAQDLGHVLEASRCGADIDVDAVPRADALDALEPDDRRRTMLTGGDDYELCFTAASHDRDAVLAAGASAKTPVTRIGTIGGEQGLRLFDVDGLPWRPRDEPLRGFDHFA